MACLEEAAGSRQHHANPIAAKVTRVEPGRKYLVVHARQLALEPGLQILRRHPRSLLLRLEQAHRYALEDNVHRDKRMGLSVVISETWYKFGLKETDGWVFPGAADADASYPSALHPR